MTNTVGKELKENNVKDNPFDNLLYYSFELTRTLLFASKRYKNVKENGMQIAPEKIVSLTNGITNELNILKNLSDETVEFCKGTSCARDAKKVKSFDSLGSVLLKNEENLETSKMYTVPCRNDRFEQARLGTSSKEYKRLLELRELTRTAPELKNAGEDYLYSLCDTIYDVESGDKTSCHKKEVIQKYGLTEHDLEYIIALKKRGKSFLTEIEKYIGE